MLLVNEIRSMLDSSLSDIIPLEDGEGRPFWLHTAGRPFGGNEATCRYCSTLYCFIFCVLGCAVQCCRAVSGMAGRPKIINFRVGHKHATYFLRSGWLLPCSNMWKVESFFILIKNDLVWIEWRVFVCRTSEVPDIELKYGIKVYQKGVKSELL